MRFLPAFMIVCLLAFPVSGQLFCDVNGDSMFTGADITHLVRMLDWYPESFSACGLNCDIDNDGESMTIADVAMLFYGLRNPGGEPPYFSYNPTDDTVKIAPAQTSPGDLLSVPVYMNTADTVIAYEFLMMINPDYITISDFIPDEDFEFYSPFSTYRLHINYVGIDAHGDLMYCPPGNYHLGDLVLNVNPDINQPVTTYVTFRTCPEDNFYTGMANMTFFVPVLVDGEITITPTGIDDQNSVLPEALSIEAYPNPFNGSVNLQVRTGIADRLIIYDILGREIKSFEINAGMNTIGWTGTDSNDKPVNSGVYFARLQNRPECNRKLLLIK